MTARAGASASRGRFLPSGGIENREFYKKNEARPASPRSRLASPAFEGQGTAGCITDASAAQRFPGFSVRPTQLREVPE